MQGIHPVFHVSLLRKHTPDTIDKTSPVRGEGGMGSGRDIGLPNDKMEAGISGVLEGFWARRKFMGARGESGQLHQHGSNIQLKIPRSSNKTQEETAKEVRESFFPLGFLMLPQGEDAEPKEEDQFFFSDFNKGGGLGIKRGIML
jgi:hypothetical protein